MKTLSSALQTEKAATQAASCYAIEILATTSVRICNWSQAVTFDGDTYTPLIPIGKPSLKSSGGMTDGGTIRIGDVDDSFKSLLFSGALKRKEISVFEIFFDADNVVVDGEILFNGEINRQESILNWFTLGLGAFSDQKAAQSPRRRIVPGCGFVFKSLDCGYSGGTAHCPKTYEGCLSSNYGGFRWIPAPGKVFVWGDEKIKVG